MIISNCPIDTSNCWKHLLLEGFRGKWHPAPFCVWSWIILSVKHSGGHLSLISGSVCFSLIVASPSSLSACVWGREDRETILPLKSAYPSFQELLYYALKKGWGRNFPVKIEGERVSEGINGQKTGAFQTLLVMWNLPESSHGDYQCPQTIAGELATVGIWGPSPPPLL